MSGTVQVVTFYQMKGAIGSLVWLWSGLERDLAAAIRKLHAGEIPRAAHGISRSLDVWSERVLNAGEDRGLQTRLCQRLLDLLMEALTVRNLVCHGLVGITAQHHHTDPEAHLEVESGGDRRILTWSELEQMFSWMSRAGSVIQALTSAAMERDVERGTKMLVAYEDFPRQK